MSNERKKFMVKYNKSRDESYKLRTEILMIEKLIKNPEIDSDEIYDLSRKNERLKEELIEKLKEIEELKKFGISNIYLLSLKSFWTYLILLCMMILGFGFWCLGTIIALIDISKKASAGGYNKFLPFFSWMYIFGFV